MHPVESDRQGGAGERCGAASAVRTGRPVPPGGSTSAGTGQHPWGEGEIGGGEVTGRVPRGPARR